LYGGVSHKEIRYNEVPTGATLGQQSRFYNVFLHTDK